MKCVLSSVILSLCLVPVSRGQTSSHTATDDELRIRGIFNSALPGTEQKHSLRLILHPHFGDVHQRDHLRIPFGLRYGVTERLEVMGETEAYVAHGLGHETAFSDAGFSALHFGTKYQLGKLPRTDWDTAIGLDYTRPMGASSARKG